MRGMPIPHTGYAGLNGTRPARIPPDDLPITAIIVASPANMLAHPRVEVRSCPTGSVIGGFTRKKGTGNRARAPLRSTLVNWAIVGGGSPPGTSMIRKGVTSCGGLSLSSTEVVLSAVQPPPSEKCPFTHTRAVISMLAAETADNGRLKLRECAPLFWFNSALGTAVMAPPGLAGCNQALVKPVAGSVTRTSPVMPGQRLRPAPASNPLSTPDTTKTRTAVRRLRIRRIELAPRWTDCVTSIDVICNVGVVLAGAGGVFTRMQSSRLRLAFRTASRSRFIAWPRKAFCDELGNGSFGGRSLPEIWPWRSASSASCSARALANPWQADGIGD